MKRWLLARNRDGVEEQVDSQTAYALWAASYPPHAHNRLMEIEQQTVETLLPDLRGLTALDAGCGSGRYLRTLRERGARAIGVDLSAAMLARAREESPRLLRADICALPIDAMAVDVVVCALALGDVVHLELALGELARVLRPGGVVVYSVVHPAGAEAGWSRTFEADGRRLAIRSHWHSAAEHRQACAAVGLLITAWAEPLIPEAPEHPAVLVVRASR
jgi:malonyl-CoA O-methyltransferase